MTLTDSEREEARDMGVSESQLSKAESDMAQAKRDFEDDAEDRRLGYVDALKDCNRCPLTTEELLDCSLEQLEQLYQQHRE